jgi:hypothetical protein
VTVRKVSQAETTNRKFKSQYILDLAGHLAQVSQVGTFSADGFSSGQFSFGVLSGATGIL